MNYMLSLLFSLNAFAQEVDQYWLEVKAENKYERTAIVEKGFVILELYEDSVVVLGNLEKEQVLKKQGLLINSYPVNFRFGKDFPNDDKAYHSFSEMEELLRELQKNYPQLIKVKSIGRSHEGRELYSARLTVDHNQVKPGIVFMGGHHAREHLSMEIPIRLMEYLLQEYRAGNPRIVSLFENHDTYFIPMVNPDGKVHDLVEGSYSYWRKNRSLNANGTVGVDLNRNYDLAWGTTGTSSDPGSDVYSGPSAFSEPETRAIKKFHEDHSNIKISISFHTYSQLILYPWGHTSEKLINEDDFQVHKRMAEKMAGWNGYQPMQSADLYEASGDTTDWTYGALGMISFTFELDPKSFLGGGFYPGDEIIGDTFLKNLEPALYLIEHSDNPYRVLKE